MGKWIETKLSDCLEYERPDSYIENGRINEFGEIPVLTANKSFILGFSDNVQNSYTKIPAIIFDDFTTDKKFVDFKYKVKSSAIKILKNRYNCDLRFMFELMQNYKFTVAEHKRHYISEYQKKVFLIPESIKEQEKIAEILGELDKVIDTTKKLIDKYTLIKEGMLQDLLPNGIDENGKIRSEATHKYKESPLGRIPVEWECVKIKDILFGVTQGLQIAIEDRFVKDIYSEKYLYITIDYINSGKNEYYVDKQVQSVHCSNEDILLTRTGDTGTAITGIEGVFHNNFFKCLINEKSVLKDYFFIWLNRKNMKEYFKNVSGITTIPDLKHKDFLNTKIALPLTWGKSLDEQGKIIDKVNSISEIIEIERSYLRKLQLKKQALMQDLLTNKVSVDCLL